jgi:hypothetical protein
VESAEQVEVVVFQVLVEFLQLRVQMVQAEALASVVFQQLQRFQVHQVLQEHQARQV